MKGEAFAVVDPPEVKSPDSLSTQSTPVCADFPQARQLKLQMQMTEPTVLCVFTPIPHSL